MIKLGLDFENLKELEESKFFGEILLPEKWFQDDIISPDELFVCQINLEELSDANYSTILPKTGTLFFFIDMKKPPYKSIIRYFDGELDAYTSLNDDFELDVNVIDEVGILFDGGDEVAMFTGDTAEGYDTCLLKIKNDILDPLLPFGGDVYFFINKSDILNGDFTNTKLVIKK